MDINSKFNCQDMKRKAIMSLQGIIAGVAADEKLKEEEVIFLSSWIADQTHIKKDGDLLDLQDLIEDILEDGVVTEDEREDVISLMETILEYSEVTAISLECLVNKFLGFLMGIASDNHLSDEEIYALRDLINSEPSAQQHFAVKKIKSCVDSVLDDNVITEDERTQLLEDVKAISGQQFLDTGVASGLSMEAFVGDITFDSIEGLSVCFTGTFNHGIRKEVESMAKDNGVSVAKGINRKLDVLVIGGTATSSWKFSSFGRKIEAVYDNRDNHDASTIIIDEPTWFALLGAK